MSSKKYAAPLHLSVSSSRSLLVLLCSLHFFSFVLLFFLPIPLVYLIAGLVFVLVSACYSLFYHVTKALPSSVIGLIWDIEDEWFLLQRNGDKKLVTLDGNSFIHPLIAILNFKQKGRFLTRSVILLSDNIGKNTFRRLRVRLKVTNLSREFAE